MGHVQVAKEGGWGVSEEGHDTTAYDQILIELTKLVPDCFQFGSSLLPWGTLQLPRGRLQNGAQALPWDIPCRQRPQQPFMLVLAYPVLWVGHLR